MKKNNESKTSKVIKAAGIAGAAIGGAVIPNNMVMAHEITEELENQEEQLLVQEAKNEEEDVVLAAENEQEVNSKITEEVEVTENEVIENEVIEDEADAEAEAPVSENPYAEYDKLLKELADATEETKADKEQAVAESIINLNNGEGIEVSSIERNEDGTLSVTYVNEGGEEVTKEYRYENVDGEIKVYEYNKKLTVDAGIVTEYKLPGIPVNTPIPNLNGTKESLVDTEYAPSLSFDYADGKATVTLEGKTYDKPTQEGDYLVFTIQSNNIKTTTVRVLKDGTEAEINEYGPYSKDHFIRVNSGLNEDINSVKSERNNNNLIQTTKIAGNDVVHFGNIDALTGSKVIIRDSVGNYRRLVDKETGAEIKVVSGLLWNMQNVSFLDGGEGVVGAHRIGVDEFGEYHLYDNNGKAVKDLKVDSKTFVMFEMKRESILYSEMGFDEGALQGHEDGYKDYLDKLEKELEDRGEETPGTETEGGETEGGETEGGETEGGETEGGETEGGETEGGETEGGETEGGETEGGETEGGETEGGETEGPAAPATPEAPVATDAPAADTTDVAPATPEAPAATEEQDTPAADTAADAEADAAEDTAPAAAATTTTTATTNTPANAEVPLAEVNLNDVETPLDNLQVGDIVELDDIESPQSAIALGTAAWWSAIPLVGAAASVREKLKGNKKQKANDDGDIIEGLDDDVK